MATFEIPDKDLETTIDRSADSFLIYDDSASKLVRTNVNSALNITGAPVGTTDSQTLTNKTIPDYEPVKGADDNYVTGAEKTVIGNTSGTNTGDNAVNSNYSGLTQYTDEQAQDAVGGMIDSTLTYTDGTPELKVSNPVTPAATGFTVTAGTTPKTLTVPLDASVSGTNTGDQTIPDSVDDLGPSQTGNNGKFLYTNGTNATWESIPGGGDMLAATYDPAGGAEQVAFASDLATVATTGAYSDLSGTPSIPTQYTDEMAQDAVGGMVDTTLTYTDGTPELKVSNPVTPAAVGFTVTAGTTAKTLTVPLDASVSGTNTGDNAANTSIAATKLDDFTAPDDNTDLNATTSAHGLLLKATAPASGLYNYVGITNGETAYSNKALFDATAPTNCILGNSAAVGTATVAARRDHQHAMPTLTTMYNLFYPVGCIYTTTVSTNPGTLFGIGTWEAFGEGKVLVGKAAAGTFNTAGATGGAETVTLTGAQSGIAAHSHTFPSGNKNNAWSAPNYVNSYQYQAEAISTTTTTSTAGATNAAESHTNLQPYVVVYYWKRTA